MNILFRILSYLSEISRNLISLAIVFVLVVFGLLLIKANKMLDLKIRDYKKEKSDKE